MSAHDDCITRWNQIAKPPGSMGAFETLTAKIAAIQQTADIDISKKAALVFCADNGVCAQGVSSYGREVTAALYKLHMEGKSAVSVLARRAGADRFIFSLGETEDMTHGPAMTEGQAQAAIEVGRAAVIELSRKGYRLFAVGETGMGNTTAAAALAAVLLNADVEAVTGRGAGLSDEGLARKRAAIARAIEINQPTANNPLSTLAKVGSLDIAAMCGAFLAAQEVKAAMVIDGVISAVAALCACRINPQAIDYMLPSHLSAEPAAALVFNALGLSPILHANMRLGEGTGAALLFPLLDAALAVYNEAATFADL